LYLLPFAAPLIAMTVAEIFLKNSRPLIHLLPFIGATCLQATWGSLRGWSADRFDVMIALGIGAVGSSLFLLLRPWWQERRRFAGIRFTGLGVGVNVAVVALTIALLPRHFLNVSPTDLSVQPHTVDLCNLLQSLRQPQYQLFVWGWQTRIYPATMMVPASQFVSVQHVVHDIARRQIVPEKVAATSEMRQLILELSRNRPRFIMDASRHTYSVGDPKMYELKRSPLVESLLDRNYVLMAECGDYSLYELKQGQ
jgi:hypothetical protein